MYARGSTLYYFALAQLAEGRVLAEELRRVGDGRTANVRWSAAGTLYYLDGSIVYAIEPGELFTRALYAGFLPIGRVAGKIPFAFDPSFDRFHVSPDGRSVLLDKGGRNVFLYRLAAGDFRATGNPVALPYLYLPRNTTVRRVVWSRANVITLLCAARSGGKELTTIFRLVPDASGAFGPFVPAPETGVRDLVLSPDEASVALVTADAVSWKDYASWKDRGRAQRVSPLAVLWIADDELLVAGAWTTERLRTDTGAATLVALSQVERFGHTADGGVVAQARGTAWTFDGTAGAWKPAAAYSPVAPSTASAAWRVYLEPSARGSYRNLVMVRDAQGFGTEPLFAAEPSSYEAFSAEDEPVDFGNVTHGSRIRRREVALVFNAMESDEGLAGILETLAAYGITATFFVNGEFIRRYPDAVKEIADSGHEVGSAFYRAFHMVDARFSVDRAFVQEGLAANEDEYFAATGRELALLWHAPGYLVSSDIIAAGAAMNYTYVGRDVEAKDWVSAADAGAAPGHLPVRGRSRRAGRGRQAPRLDRADPRRARRGPPQRLPVPEAGPARERARPARLRHRARFRADRARPLGGRYRERHRSRPGLPRNPDQDRQPDQADRDAVRRGDPAPQPRARGSHGQPRALRPGQQPHRGRAGHRLGADGLARLRAGGRDRPGALLDLLLREPAAAGRQRAQGPRAAGGGEAPARRTARRVGRHLRAQGPRGARRAVRRCQHRPLGGGGEPWKQPTANAAVLVRLRGMLVRQREKFAAYLDVLEREEEAIREGDADRLAACVELEGSVIADIYTLKKVIDPLEDLYQAAWPGREPAVTELKSTLERMSAEVIDKNAANRALLKKKMDEMRLEIASLRRWPRPPSSFAPADAPSLVDIMT